MRDLNEKEIDVVKLVAEGKGNKFIANKLCHSEWVVRYRLKNIYKKLGIKGSQPNKRVNLALWGHGVKI